MLTFTALFWLIVLVVLAKWVFAGSDRALPENARRLELEVGRLREELDRLSMQVARLEDEQSFMVRLLSEDDRRLLQKGRDEAAGEHPSPRARLE